MLKQILSFLDRSRQFLNARSFLFYLIILTIVYLVSAAAVLARYEFNPSSLVRFGEYYARQNPDLIPEGAVIFIGNEEHGGNGYDGQIFYFFGRTLFSPGAWPAGFNNAYRAPRIGYPFLAGLFSVFGSGGVVCGMILTQISLIAFSALCLFRLLHPDRRYLLLFYVISPFNLQCFTLLVSDSVMISLCVIGWYLLNRAVESQDSCGINRKGCRRATALYLLSWIFFSLALLTKESALFFLFPLGLAALLRLRYAQIAVVAGTLLPYILWQLYLRQAHGMVPAGVLKIFLSPLDGILGLADASLFAAADFLRTPGGAAAGALVKISARILLLLMIPAAIYTLFSGRRSQLLPFRLALVLLLASVIIADYYYFWGIYENISRMFTLIVPILILLKNQDDESYTAPAFGILSVLFVMVFIRIVFLTPQFPYEIYKKYQGPQYERAPVPGMRAWPGS